MSQLVIQRRGADLSAEFVVTDRRALYQSPIWLTPYLDGNELIDVDALRARFDNAYEEAGIRPDAIDTGAVVITGEALKKENAEQIARMLAGWSGRFICVSAGPNHEAILAAHGSGSVAASAKAETIVVNVDVGGGTTKISVIDNGVITHLESVSVGARLLSFDDSGRIARIEEPARVILRSLGLTVDLGDVLTLADRSGRGRLDGGRPRRITRGRAPGSSSLPRSVRGYRRPSHAAAGRHRSDRVLRRSFRVPVRRSARRVRRPRCGAWSRASRAHRRGWL